MCYYCGVHPTRIEQEGALGYYGVNRGVFPPPRAFEQNTPSLQVAPRQAVDRPAAFARRNEPCDQAGLSRRDLFPQRPGRSWLKPTAVGDSACSVADLSLAEEDSLKTQLDGIWRP